MQLPHLAPALQQRLAAHAAERGQLVARASELLMADPQVSAAWLFGSLGRGDEDELSDIDLFVIVRDADHPAFVAERYALMAHLGEPLLILEAPQNWPPGGVYNMALYAATEGPLQVDWYWVRQSVGAIPSETRLLFDRANLPRLTTPTQFDYAPVPDRPPEEIATQDVNLFWVMLLIAAKYLARLPNEQVIPPPVDALRRTAEFAGVARDGLPTIEPTPTDPLARLAALRTLAQQMEEMMPAVIAHGGRVPIQIVPAAQRYLDLIEAILRPNLV
jgi:predicted nucleotidyltransferase